MVFNSILSRKGIGSFLFVIALAIILVACSSESQVKKPEKNSGKSVFFYETTPVRLLNPTYTLAVPGALRPFEEVEIYARVPGFVQKINVDRGTFVRENQLIAVLEAPEMEQQYLSDRSVQDKMYSDFLFAQQSYERLKEAAQTDGAVARLELDRAKSAMLGARSAYESSKAGTAGASQLKKYLRIRAPFDGVVTARNFSPGALVGPDNGKPMFTIAQYDRLRLTLFIPESHAASVNEDTKAAFTVRSLPGKTFHAVMSRNSEVLSNQNKSLALEFDVDNKDSILKGGAYARVQLSLRRNSPSLWVPEKSIVNASSGMFVLRMAGKKIERVPVSRGTHLDSIVEVFGNISAEDMILAHPSEEIPEGKINE